MKNKQIQQFRETYTGWKNDRTVLSKGLQLVCHYDEHEDVKRMGGMWNPDEKIWWMPAKCLNNNCPIDLTDDGRNITVLEWLNNHKMVDGEYGNIDSQAAKSATLDVEPDITARLTRYDDKDIGVNFYKDLDLVEFATPNGVGIEFKTATEGRIRWDEFIKEGYVHV